MCHAKIAGVDVCHAKIAGVDVCHAKIAGVDVCHAKIGGVDAGRQILWEPGNQVPTKCLSSSKFFGRIHAFSRIDRISLTEGYELTRNNSCDMN